MMERANQFYREKQYEQHHHHQDTDKALSSYAATAAATATASSSTKNIIDTPWDKYKTTLDTLTQNQVEHDETSDRLQIIKNMVTWDDYKHLVTELQRKKEECSKLQEEVDNLKMRLVEEVEEEGSTPVSHHRYRTPGPQVVVGDDDDDGGKDDIIEDLELKTLADKAMEYDETIQESKEVNHGDSVRWH